MKKQTRVHSPFPGSLKQILLEVDDTIAIIKKENVRTIGAVKQKANILTLLKTTALNLRQSLLKSILPVVTVLSSLKYKEFIKTSTSEKVHVSFPISVLP